MHEPMHGFVGTLIYLTILTTPLPEPLAATTQTERITLQEEVLAEKHYQTHLAISGGTSALVLTLASLAWWKDVGFRGFTFKESGGFQRWTYAGGSDKLGHFYANYIGVKALHSLYQSAGLSHHRALQLATMMTAFLANTVEIIDGFTPHRFEYGDVIGNLLGLATANLFIRYPKLDEAVGFRISYLPSTYFYQREKNPIKVANDYSGQTYFADIKWKGFLEALGHTPGFTRYFLSGIHYSTLHYRPKVAALPKERQLGFHLGLALHEILAGESNGAWLKGFTKFTKYFALPFLQIGVHRDLNSKQWAINFGLANRFNMPLN